MKILLAIDGSACSEAALAEVASRPWPAGSEVKIVTAYDLPLMPTPEAWAISPEYCNELEQAIREQAQTTVDHASATLCKALGKSFKLTSKVIAGPPKSAILEQAELWGADLIVVGSHGYSRWERFLLGSVSQAVVSHAKCSVEVVRCKQHQLESTEAA